MQKSAASLVLSATCLGLLPVGSCLLSCDGGTTTGGPQTCATLTCGTNATCIEAREGAACACAPGFEGNGFTCSRILLVVPGEVRLLVGRDLTGAAHNVPTDWPAAAGTWNAKVGRYNPATRQLAFESHREDIVAGSVRPASGITAAGVTEYYVAGPATGTNNVSGTVVVYVADEAGRSARCLGCIDVVDGVDWVEIYKVSPSSTSTANSIVRQVGATVYANQNKDLPAWYPDGTFILMAVEMPRHALTHHLGNGAIGMFNDLWAVSTDGKTWVQLTDYVSTWSRWDPVAYMPYACADTSNCSAGCQYRSTTGGAVYPFDAYSCSTPGAPPPASGVMRPALSNGWSGTVAGSARMVWAERVGISPAYAWGGVLQLAEANIVLAGGLPALANYRRNLTPTPTSPTGAGLWSNPGGNTSIGAGYETWSFSADDSLVGFATDAFLSTSDASVTRTISPSSQAFTDAVVWRWNGFPATLTNVTSYDAVVYAYQENAGPFPASKYGHWEEPMVFSPETASVRWIAFGSSADLNPPWDPFQHFTTFGLEVWIVREDRATPARRISTFNEPSTAPRVWAYPTDAHSDANVLYVTAVPNDPGANPPGAIYAIGVPTL